ncbi:nitroreductase family protein [Streptomyces sp. V1I1]|uniref:nitroreductase family protein n=1 Tax=Streptomyces sp. V1I1 TaxID=3042272 RepID=UPI0027802F25|nr:nitroreductase family protein [Streptomyces sp. V1I1]MDQ0938369.1 hypothetical protein [Streptomyces sp. V1I1]
MTLFHAGRTASEHTGRLVCHSWTSAPANLLSTTRSVRKRLDLVRLLPLELVKECLAIALQAPTGSNRRTWHWMVVTDPDRRAAIGEFYRQAVQTYSRGSCGILYTEGAERHAVQRRVADSVAYLGDRLDRVSFHIPCLDASAVPEYNEPACGGRSSRPPGVTCSRPGHAASEPAWTTLHLMYEKEIAELFELPDGLIPAALLRPSSPPHIPSARISSPLRGSRWTRCST